MSVMTPTTPATAPLPTRTLATLALAVSLLLHRCPLYWRLALVRQLHRLPSASLTHVQHLHTAVLAATPAWWPGRIACMETSLATVVATALTGRQARWVLGARCCPDAAHAWTEVPEGAVGRDEGDAGDRPWTCVLTVPEPPTHSEPIRHLRNRHQEAAPRRRTPQATARKGSPRASHPNE